MDPLKVPIVSESLKKDLVALEYPEFLQIGQDFRDKIQIANVSYTIFAEFANS